MDQWAKMSERFHEWGPPLRPSKEDVAIFKKEIGSRQKVLLLGATEELVPFASLIVDNNPKVIKNYRGEALLADWRELPFDRVFDAVIGDGCLTVFQGPSELFFEKVKKVLRPGGELILRLFTSPEKKEDLEEVLSERGKMGFHAFKWRVAHALANPYVPVMQIYETIRPIWNHPTLDVYKDSELIYYFPKLSELPPWDRIEFNSSYQLAERCPIVTWLTNSSNLPEGNVST